MGTPNTPRWPHAGQTVLPRWLWRALGVTIALKLVALAVLFTVSFGPHHRPAVQNPQAVADRLLGPATTSTAKQ